MIQPRQFNEEEFDNSLSKHLRASGDLFPQTEEEFLDALDKMPEEMILPEKFKDPFKILNEGSSISELRIESFEDRSVEENLARAAREGGNIPEAVKRRMEADRIKAEKKKGDK